MRTDGLPSVSVILPIRNEARRIGDCLSALSAQVYPNNRLEIICAEGCSTDGTREVIERAAARDTRIRVVDNPSGRTPDALNAALAAARGDVIALMGAHALAPPDYVALCVAALQRTGAWCVGGRLLKVGDGPNSAAIAAATSSRFGVGNSAHHYAISARSVDSVFPGCWPRWVFDRIGGFDPELTRNQDDELSYRIRQLGGTIWFDPLISVRYHTRESHQRLFEQHRQYGFWRVRVLLKHPRSARWRHFVPAALVASPFVGAIGRGIPGIRGAATVGLGAYVVATLTISARIAHSRPDMQAMEVAKAFAAMHLGYGIGFWQGVLHFLPTWPLQIIARAPTQIRRRRSPSPRNMPLA